jgi:broad specificity phosphatase PhoE
MEPLLQTHGGETLVVVAHHIVNRTYLAGVLGLSPDQARQVTLDNCGISVVVRQGRETSVTTLNAAFHLQGVAA